MATDLTTIHPRIKNPTNDDNNGSESDRIIPTRKANRLYFIFYFFLWMFIGSLWILPPLLFNKILVQCDLSLFSTSILFSIYYTLNGIASLISRLIINSDYLMKTHLLTSLLIIICIISFQFMLLTRNYLHQMIIWITISIVDGYLNNAAPVYLYRIYHIEASIMLTLCTIIANFTMVIIAMSSINSGLSYGGTLNFISFFGVVCCLGLIVLKTPTQNELNEAIKQCRNEIIESKLERIQTEEQLKRKSRSNAVQYDSNCDNKWNSMRNSVLFNNRSSVSGTLSTYFHEHAPEISFNPSVIHTINAANKGSHIQYPINAKLPSIKIRNKNTKPSATSSPNTFASTNVRKMTNIIAYCSNPPILAHSLNDSTCHTLELIWKETEDEKGRLQTPTPFVNDDDDKDDEKEICDDEKEISFNITEPNTPQTLNKLKTMSTRRRVLFSENVTEENENDTAFYSKKSSLNYPSTLGNKTPDNPYWFDIEKRFESFSLISKRADTVLASYILNDEDNINLSNKRYSATISNDKSYDVTLNRVSTLKTLVMEPINEEEKKENCENNNNLKKSKQTLFLFILWITMIYSAQKICYLTFITIYLIDFVGGKEFIGIWLITIYLFGNLLGRIIIIFVLKRYSPKNILLISQFIMLFNSVILLMIDWLHFGIPKENKESRKFTKIMLYLILFCAGFASSPINVICLSFLNAIQKVTQFLSTIINITSSASNAISIITIAAIINNFGIETFPYYIMLILFCAIIIAIAINIKYMLFTQTLRSNIY